MVRGPGNILRDNACDDVAILNEDGIHGTTGGVPTSATCRGCLARGAKRAGEGEGAGDAPLHRCAGCVCFVPDVAPSYCGRECQAADWGRHREECKRAEERARVRLAAPKALSHWEGVTASVV